VVCPGYGLAEVVAGVTLLPPGEGRRYDASGNMSCGPALPGVEVEIRGEAGSRSPTGTMGEIVVRSQSLFSGYWNDPGATAEVLVDGWLHTGDLGHLDGDGHLYVAGRKRSMIKRAGELIPARSVEEVVDVLDGVRRSAAIGVAGKGGAEELVVVVEYRGDETDHDVVARTAGRAVKEALGFGPSRVVVGGRGVVPLTENGKIRHVALREAYEAGALEANLRA
jgi:fatty-acyl-CoA synthase